MLNPIWRRAVALVCMLAMTPLAATTYYVSTNGDNNQSGTISQPWRTLQHAADEVQAGDTILVRGGDYAGANFTNSASGAADNPTVLKAYPGETPHITANNPQTPDGINLEGVSWMTIEGFVINNRSRAGIRVVGGEQWGLVCEHVTIRNNRLDQNGTWGILTSFCDDLLIENNVTSRSGEQHGIYVSNSGDRPIIRNNIIWGNRQCGIHMNGDISMGGDGVISNAIVEGNIIFDNGNGGGSSINMDGVQDSLIRNNLIFDAHASGISVYRIDGGAPSTGNRIINNTVLVASNGRWALNIQDGATNTTVRNNILLNYHNYRGSIDISASSLPGLSSDYNVLMNRMTTNGGDGILGLSAWQALTGEDMHSLVATPGQLFVGAGSDDFRLSATSPAVNAGQTRADTVIDILGMPRPQGGAYDIGAYERVAPGPIFADGFE